ncbi:BON domain-containing protein [Quatrionicoccus australiensis]|uniref:BON domain-containing protein n=1 Tax=Quatrionicoccus australiensis TaxID=138118 RepID=UPI001CF9D640|nr:BON domain-containing protein [Quatrionicoccus australiensis]MCB4358340.1 BON domain-containing protein [Quatrionicoccus australiensis]
MIKRHFAVAGFIAVVALCGLGLTAFATDDPQVIASVSMAGETLDTVLTEKVETLLRTDIGLAGSQLRVQGRAGVVTVGGTVPDEHSLRRALDLASSVRGVREVRNAMEIDSPK